MTQLRPLSESGDGGMTPRKIAFCRNWINSLKNAIYLQGRRIVIHFEITGYQFAQVIFVIWLTPDSLSKQFCRLRQVANFTIDESGISIGIGAFVV